MNTLLYSIYLYINKIQYNHFFWWKVEKQWIFTYIIIKNSIYIFISISNTSSHQVPKTTTTNSTVQPSHSREKQQPNNNKDHQQPPVGQEQQHPSSSTTYHPSLSESTASSHLSSIEPMAESTRNNIEKDYGTNDYAMSSMQEPDRPQRSAKKALLSRIFSKPPKETEDSQSSSGMFYWNHVKFKIHL